MQRSRLPRFLQRLGFPRILGLLFAFLLSIKLLSACNEQLVTLSFVVPTPEVKQWNSLIQDFQVKYPNIHIHIDGRHTEDVKRAYEEKNSDYDLVYMDSIWVPKFAEQGLLKDLSDWNLTSTKELNEFLPGDVAGGKYNQKVYRIPFRSDVGVLYYRKDLLEAANEQPPETFEDLIRISQKVQKQTGTLFGYLWHGEVNEGLSAMFLEVLKGYGGFWIHPETKEVGLDQPAAFNAVKFLRSTIEKGISPRDFTKYTDSAIRYLFLNDKAVFMRDWPIFWSDANKAKSLLRGKIAIKPMLHEGKNKSVACQGGWGLGISNNTKHEDATRTAIQFFTSAAAQRKFVLEETYLPSRKALFYDPQIVDRHSFYPKLLEVTRYPALRPSVPDYDQASKILQKHLSDALNARQDSEADEQMKIAAKETRQLLKY